MIYLNNSIKKIFLVLEEDGFGSRAFFESFVAVAKETGEIVGYALYFFVYSTWQGKSLYLEDVYVQPAHRKRGIGSAFFHSLAQVIAFHQRDFRRMRLKCLSPVGLVLKAALKEDCQLLNFSVLNWNQPSIDFYKSLGAVDLTGEEGWHSFRLHRPQIEKLAQSK